MSHRNAKGLRLYPAISKDYIYMIQFENPSPAFIMQGDKIKCAMASAVPAKGGITSGAHIVCHSIKPIGHDNVIPKGKRHESQRI